MIVSGSSALVVAPATPDTELSAPLSLTMALAFVSLVLLYLALLAGARTGRRRRDHARSEGFGTVRQAPRESERMSTGEREAIDPTQRELIESLSLLSGVIECSPNPIFVKDLEGRYQIVNRAAAEATGRTVHEMLGRQPHAIMPAVIADRVAEADRRVIETGEPLMLEQTMVTDSGERTYLSVKTPYRGPDNVLRGLIGVAWDITARKRDEEARVRHCAILDLTSDFVVTLDPGGGLTYLNPAARNALALAPDEAAPQSLSDYFTESAATVLMREAIPAVLQSGQWVGESVWRSRTGREIPVSQIILAHAGATGVVEFLSIVARDISASKAAELAMRQSEERFRALSTAAPIGIFLADAAGLATYFNSRWSAISGLSVHASLGFGWVDALHPEDRTETISSWLQAVAEGGEWKHEHRIVLPGGQVRWVHAMASPIRVTDGVTGFAGTVEDITARREADERLRESNQRLRALTAYSQQVLEDEQTRIAREIHDQLGQSLTALKMDTAWLARRFQGTPRDQAADRLQQMGELIDSTVQTVRRISTGLRPAVLDEFGLSAAIEWALGEFEKRTGITCVLQDEAPRGKLADDTSTAVFRIFQEGLTNIARHAAASSVVVRLNPDHGWFVMTMQDNGRGMPDGAGPANSLGILGMHERAALVGGNVEVESAPGCGTRLRVCVPRPQSRHS